MFKSVENFSKNILISMGLIPRCLRRKLNPSVGAYSNIPRPLAAGWLIITTGVAEMNTDELSWLLAGLEWQKMRDWQARRYARDAF